MARPEITGSKPTNPKAAIDADCYSVDEFCASHRISRQLFYKKKSQGVMPATIKIGARTLIPRTAAAAWLERELAAQTANGTT